MNESIVKLALTRFKKNASTYIAVGAFCGLLIILAATLSFIDVLLFYFAIAFIVFPFLFASSVACFFLENNQTITVSSMFKYSVGFYSPQFRSSFRGIKSFLLSLAIYAGVMVVTYVACFSVFKGLHGDVFTDAFKNLLDVYMSETSTYDDMLNCLNENNGLLLTFIMYVSSIPLPLAAVWFIYSTSFNSITIYYRLKLKPQAYPLMKLAINDTYSRNRHNMRKDWFKLNWPLLVLSFVGSVAAILITAFFIENISLLPAIVSLGSVALIVFFLPFYFSNMEVIYSKYEGAFKKGSQAAVENVMRRIQNSLDLSEEDKKDLENSFKEEDGEEE